MTECHKSTTVMSTMSSVGRTIHTSFLKSRMVTGAEHRGSLLPAHWTIEQSPRTKLRKKSAKTINRGKTWQVCVQKVWENIFHSGNVLQHSTDRKSVSLYYYANLFGNLKQGSEKLYVPDYIAYIFRMVKRFATTKVIAIIAINAFNYMKPIRTPKWRPT